MASRDESSSQRERRSPQLLVEYAADAAMAAANHILEREGAKLTTMIVLLHAEQVPEGELDCCSAGHGYDDGRELLADVFGHFAGAAKQLGIEVKIAPLGRG